jgi:hypothetical protein
LRRRQRMTTNKQHETRPYNKHTTAAALRQRQQAHCSVRPQHLGAAAAGVREVRVHASGGRASCIPSAFWAHFCTFKLLQHLLRLAGMPKRLHGVARCEGRLALERRRMFTVAFNDSTCAPPPTDYVIDRYSAPPDAYAMWRTFKSVLALPSADRLQRVQVGFI